MPHLPDFGSRYMFSADAFRCPHPLVDQQCAFRLRITQMRGLCHPVAFDAANILKKESVAYLLLSSSQSPNKLYMTERILDLAGRLYDNTLVNAVNLKLLSYSTKR